MRIVPFFATSHFQDLKFKLNGELLAYSKLVARLEEQIKNLIIDPKPRPPIIDDPDRPEYDPNSRPIYDPNPEPRPPYIPQPRPPYVDKEASMKAYTERKAEYKRVVHYHKAESQQTSLSSSSQNSLASISGLKK